MTRIATMESVVCNTLHAFWAYSSLNWYSVLASSLDCDRGSNPNIHKLHFCAMIQYGLATKDF